MAVSFPNRKLTITHQQNVEEGPDLVGDEEVAGESSESQLEQGKGGHHEIGAWDHENRQLQPKWQNPGVFLEFFWNRSIRKKWIVLNFNRLIFLAFLSFLVTRLINHYFLWIPPFQKFHLPLPARASPGSRCYRRDPGKLQWPNRRCKVVWENVEACSDGLRGWTWRWRTTTTASVWKACRRKACRYSGGLSGGSKFVYWFSKIIHLLKIGKCLGS